jgi:hypothetical protein
MPKNNSGFHFEGKTSNFFNFLYFILMNVTDVHFFIFFRSGRFISYFILTNALLMLSFFYFLDPWMPKNNFGFYFEGKTSNFFNFLYFILMNITKHSFYFF